MLAAAANAEDFPAATWRDQLNPLASPDAYPGGEISIFLGQYPKSLNYYLDPSTQSAQIFGSLFETLLSMNPVTLEYEPGLADRWSISADKKEFTFFIDRQAQWSDGRPVTAQDVKWTYDVIMDPKNLTGSHKIDMERFYPPEVIDSHTIRFRTKNVHWRNLGAAGGFYILPKHALAGLNFNKVNFEFPVVSGLYRIGTIKEGIFLELIRRDNWWQRKFLRNQGTGNFQTLKFRFYAERENAFEAFKKGMIDLYPVYTARLWVNETRGERFDKNWIIKQKVHNHNPVGFQGFAMNMRKPPFNDVKVRQAMAYLLDRRKMNRTLMYNQYFQHRAYYEGLYSKEVPCPNPLIEFDPGKARALLKEAGWQVNSGTGNLEKNGQPFTFKFLTRSASSEKFLAIYAEDLKDVGIQLVIDKKDWAAWARDMDEFNYQMTWAAWGPSIFIDPEGMWSSSEADRKGGNNITGFKSQIVDQLIEKQKHIFEIQKRNVINRRIDHIIAKTFPYVLLWNINYTRLLYWNKFGTPDSVLSKYGSESSAYAYWWFDEDSAAELSEAREAKLVLPPKPAVVYFDDVFQSQPMQ
jgi:microcin C transport system substrate-binding protein